MFYRHGFKFFFPKRYQFLYNTSPPVIFFQLYTLKPVTWVNSAYGPSGLSYPKDIAKATAEETFV